MIKRIGIALFATALLSTTAASEAQAGPGRWVSNALAGHVAKRAWNKHARKQVRMSNENGRRNGSFIAQIFRSAHIKNAKPSTDKKHTNFDGHFSWTTGRGGSGVQVGPIPARVQRGSTLDNLKRAFGRQPLPQVELQPVHALEATPARR